VHFSFHFTPDSNTLNELQKKKGTDPRNERPPVVQCVTTLLAHQVLGNVSLLLNQIFCFTVLEIYRLLVVYSLHRELKSPPPQLPPPTPIFITNITTTTIIIRYPVKQKVSIELMCSVIPDITVTN
jgi:hypothetical protein